VWVCVCVRVCVCVYNICMLAGCAKELQVCVCGNSTFVLKQPITRQRQANEYLQIASLLHATENTKGPSTLAQRYSRAVQS
jgi:hypothetical protein